MPFGPMAGMGMFMNMLEQQKAERAARQEARANILGQSARSLGAPTYNVQAAGAEADIARNRDAQRKRMLMQLLGGYGGGGQGMTGGGY